MDLSNPVSTIELFNPLDLIEAVAHAHEFPTERSGDQELTLAADGSWCDYSLTFSWHDEVEVLHMAAAFDMKITEEKRREVSMLIALINEQLLVGHFDLWTDEGLVLFRHSLLLNGDAQVTEEQADAMVQLAVESCERYYPAFHFVVATDKSAHEAIQASMFETYGNA